MVTKQNTEWLAWLRQQRANDRKQYHRNKERLSRIIRRPVGLALTSSVIGEVRLVVNITKAEPHWTEYYMEC